MQRCTNKTREMYGLHVYTIMYTDGGEKDFHHRQSYEGVYMDELFMSNFFSSRPTVRYYL